MALTGARFPAHWEADVVAADGGTVHLRPITAGDADALVALHNRLSDRTIHFRFFSPRPRLSARDIERFTVVDHDDRVALVAQLGDDMIAVARYDRIPGSDDAEVAFVVEDLHQGRGLGTIMLEHLAAAARERGISRFVAETLPDNRRMIGVFRDAGWEATSRLEDGIVRVEFPIDPTPGALAAQQEREQRSEARSMRRLLAPRSIAVIGASRTPGTIGHELFRSLLDGGFAGPVYPVHRHAAHVGSVRAYASVVDVPDDVDLAVVVVPAASVRRVVEECAEKRVRGVVVVSAGFGELGDDDGVEAERGLVTFARRHGMRVIGPSSMGVVNTDPEVSMHATIAGAGTLEGRVGFLSQSGALGIAILEWASGLGLGVSTFVSVGNKADVSGNDLLQYWEDDDHTDVVLLYLESFGNPRKFARVARRVSRVKPIVAVKGGRRPGRAATSSLTAAAASADVAVDALFRQTGVVRVDTLEQLFDVASVLARQPLPAGRRVALLTSSGGPGLLAADACEGAGLQLASLAAATRGALSAAVPGATNLRNPVDMASWASADDYGRALELVLADDDVDVAIVVFTPPLRVAADDVAAAVAAAGRASGKPVVANFLAVRGDVPAPPSIPVFRSPEAAALALARAADYADWRRRPEGRVPDLTGVDVAAARLLVEAALNEQPDGTWLSEEASAHLLAHVGLPVLSTTTVVSRDEAMAAAAALDGPVVVIPAAVAEQLDVATASEVPLPGPDAAGEAFDRLVAASGEPFAAVVRPAVARETDLVLGVVQDPTFGPLVMLGSGSSTVTSRAFRVTPLTDVDVTELVDASAASVVESTAGSPITRAVVEDLLLRVGRLVDEVPELSEMDLVPVLATGSGALAVHGRLRLSPWSPRPELALRRMR
ncbi:MAG TPA: GNAT family N-acetyltransferase [Acidimicrobiales bacterium]|nr:GNAT family N-acetyltransferase [Acidimicrobiales bacterium]